MSTMNFTTILIKHTSFNLSLMFFDLILEAFPPKKLYQFLVLFVCLFWFLFL